jgi:hypothetical protein
MLRRLRRRKKSAKKSANKVSRPTPVTRVYARVRSIAPKPPAPPSYPERPQAAKADWTLLQKMRGIVQDPDSKPEARAKAGEIAKAMQWWLGSGQFGQHIDKPEGTLAVEVIMERYRDAHEIEQQEKEAR